MKIFAKLFTSEPSRSYLALHFSVLLFGFTAVFGAMLPLSSIPLVWWRIFLTVGSLLLFSRIRALLRTLPLRLLLVILGTGLVTGLHWITFYESIKQSNASVGVMAMALTPLFTAFLEPIVQQRRIAPAEVIFALAILPGMFLLSGSLPKAYLSGFVVGLFSAFLASVFSTLNQKIILLSDAITITCLELGSALVLLTLVMPMWIQTNPKAVFFPSGYREWGILLFLALACTSLAYSLTLHAMKRVSAFTANLSMTLEPLYGVLLAAWLLGEHRMLSPGFYGGSALILGSVVGFTYLKRAQKNNPGD